MSLNIFKHVQYMKKLARYYIYNNYVFQGYKGFQIENTTIFLL
jgi:hypothetical protein